MNDGEGRAVHIFWRLRTKDLAIKEDRPSVSVCLLSLSAATFRIRSKTSFLRYFLTFSLSFFCIGTRTQLVGGKYRPKYFRLTGNTPGPVDTALYLSYGSLRFPQEEKMLNQISILVMVFL